MDVHGAKLARTLLTIATGVERRVAYHVAAPDRASFSLGRHPESRGENHEQAIRQHWA